MNKNILVTGGAGFIGANYVHYILKTYPDCKVTVMDKLTYAGNLRNLELYKDDSRLTFVKGDIADAAETDKIITDGGFDWIAHFAAESHVDRSITGPEEFIRTNIMGTFNILEVIRKLGWKAEDGKRMLHVSTDEVYGSLGAEGYFVEDTPYQPNSPYSASKAGSDHLVRAYFHTYGLPLVVSNCSNNYGPYQFPEKLIPLMILNCKNGKDLPIYGKGDNVRDWLYVEDHCSALDTILQKGALGECYNVGGNNEWKNIDIVNLICEVMDEKHPAGAPHKNLIKYVQDRPGHDKRYAIDATKIKNELGWEPKETFEKAIIKTIDWFLENEAWWTEILSGDYQEYYQNQYQER